MGPWEVLEQGGGREKPPTSFNTLVGINHIAAFTKGVSIIGDSASSFET